MSLQEAASSGSFSPRVAQPSDAQRSDGPFSPPMAGGDVDQASAGAASPFGSTYDYTATAEDVMGDAGQPDMRASRRRAWTVVGLAIVIPAAVAGLIAWQLFGGDEAPAPTVTRVTTTPAEQVAPEVQAVATEPVQVTVTAQPEPAAATTAVTTTSSTAAQTTTSTAAATDDGAAEAAAATAATEVDTASLTPAARLAAWTEIETIQVLPGETLWLIAQNYSTTVSAIATLNGITDPEMLSVGQELKIPVGFGEEIAATAPVVSEAGGSETADVDAPAVTATADGVPAVSDDLANWHTIGPVLVEDGDSLAAIAAANNTTIEAIMALNGISDSNLIFVGDTLLVPVGYGGDAGVAIQPTQQTSLETGTGTTPAESSDDLMEEESVSTGAGDDDDMMQE